MLRGSAQLGIGMALGVIAAPLLKRLLSRSWYRFLRLSIQENAPKILRYYKNIKADKTLIANKYSGLDKELKIVIKAYTRKSKYLATNDLK